MNAALTHWVFDTAERIAPFAAQVLVQSTLVILAGLAIARLFRSHGPALESSILRTTLVMVLLCPVASAFRSRLGFQGRQWEIPRAGPPPVAERASVSPAAKAAQPPLPSEPLTQAHPAAAVANAAPPAATKTPPAVTASRTATIGTQKQTRGALALIYTAAISAWAGAAGFLLLRLKISHRRIARMLQESDLADVRVFESCNAIADELAVPPPEVRVHTGIRSPLLIGIWRPAILLPDVKGIEDLVATREVLLHELAHRARHDCFWHLLGRIVLAALWVQPLLWLLVRRIEETAEDVCDNYVLEHARDRRAYAEQLVALAEQLQFSPAESLAGTGVIAFRSALGQRVVRILDASRNLSVRAGLGAGVGSAAAVIAGTFAISLVGVKSAARAETTITASADANIRSLISGSGEIASGALSPDESTLAYIGWEEKRSAVSIRDLKTGTTKHLVPIRNNLEQALKPIWSPDSKLVAYVWNTWESGPSVESLRMVSRDGGEPTVIWSGGPSFYPEDWSRDGKHLAGKLWGKDQPVALSTLEVATGRIQVVATPWPMPEHIRFSPDGKLLVFERFVDGNRDVFVTPLDGTHITRLTDSPAEDGTPVFSPDGRSVIFSSNRQGRWDLYAIPVVDGRPDGVAVSIKHGFPDSTKWINAAGKLAFRSGPNGDMEIMAPDVFAVDLSLQAKAPAAPRPIAKSGFGKNFAPSCSPDGKKIAYIRMRGVGAWQSALCVQSVDDGREELFETGMAKFVRIVWSPDSKCVAMRGSGPGGKWGLYLFTFATRKLTAVRLGTSESEPVGFSRDGTEFVFLDLKQKQRVLVNLDTGAQRSVAFTPEEMGMGNRASARQHSVSPDESLVAYIENVDSGQHLVVADGSFRNPRVIARAPKTGLLVWPRLSPDKQKLAYYLRTEAGQPPQLHLAAVDGSWDYVVEIAPKRLAVGWVGPSWSADSSKLIFTLVEDYPAEFGVLENFLPAKLASAK